MGTVYEMCILWHQKQEVLEINLLNVEHSLVYEVGWGEMRRNQEKDQVDNTGACRAHSSSSWMVGSALLYHNAVVNGDWPINHSNQNSVDRISSNGSHLILGWHRSLQFMIDITPICVLTVWWDSSMMDKHIDPVLLLLWEVGLVVQNFSPALRLTIMPSFNTSNSLPEISLVVTKHVGESYLTILVWKASWSTRNWPKSTRSNQILGDWACVEISP